ncbi:hypothetical protein PspLS_02189 [Pyricularia sp. CBS 133598]|nr:hypothetical protein PspLS_02189 [Pyricularia sp. CBS 133598]
MEEIDGFVWVNAPESHRTNEIDNKIYNDGLKCRISAIEEALKPLTENLWSLNKYIHDHPELGYEEHKTHDALTGFMQQQKGWQVTRSAFGIETAWTAVYNSENPGPVVAFNAEMDALPGLGHACGHNLIAIASVAAGLATAEVMRKSHLPGKVVIIGTPAEEGGGGKIKLLKAGAYAGVDVSLISHPSIVNNSPMVRTTAFSKLEVEYHGRAAHGANSPWLGINALDALIIAYNAISVLRQQTQPGDVIGLQITNGGNAPNIIHAFAAGKAVLRATSASRLQDLQRKVEACFRAGAEATGARLEIKTTPGYKDHVPNRVMAESYTKYWEALPDMPDPRIPPDGQLTFVKASTDQGDISYCMPSLNASFAIPPGPRGGPPHSPDFEKASSTEEAFERAMRVGKAMAGTAVDLIADTGLLDKVKAQWRLAAQMRLIDTNTIEVVEFNDFEIPQYAILSHTWGAEEVSYQDMQWVDRRVLRGNINLDEISVANRMRWAVNRKTTRREDMAYCLMGIYSVNMPLLYGEGGTRAFIRLQEEIMKETDDHSIFAWADQLVSDNPLHGLLASSPAAFADTQTTRCLPPLQTSDSVPMSMTNQGLRLKVFLWSVPEYLEDLRRYLPKDFGVTSQELSLPLDGYFAFLECSVVENGEFLCPVILLRNLWGDQYARINIDKVYHLRDPRTYSLDHPCSGYCSIYVKQSPREILPDFIVALEKGSSNTTVATIRFSDSARKSCLDVFVGLSKVSHGWEPWCRQSHDVSRSLWNVHQELVDDLLHSEMPQQRWESGDMMGTVAQTRLTTRYGRPYVLLEFLQKFEIDGTEILQSEDNVNTSIQTAIGTQPLPSLGPEENLASFSVIDSLETSVSVKQPFFRVRIGNGSPEHHSLLRDVDLFVLAAAKKVLPEPKDGWIGVAEATDLLGELDHASEDDILDIVHESYQGLPGFNRLHLALVTRSWKLFDRCISEGIDENTLQDIEGGVGLSFYHLAAVCSRLEQVELLHRAISAAQFKSRSNSQDVIMKIAGLRFTPTQETPLHFAAAYGRQETVADLIALLLGDIYQNGVSLAPNDVELLLQAQNYQGETPLHRACAMGNQAAAEAILALDPSGGFTIETVCKDGRTLIHAACREGCSDVAKVLLESGVRADAKEVSFGLTPAHLAPMFGHHECLEHIIRHDSDAVDESLKGRKMYCTPLHLAVANGRTRCVEVLLEAGVDISRPCECYFISFNAAHSTKNPESFDVVAANELPENIASERGFDQIAGLISQRGREAAKSHLIPRAMSSEHGENFVARAVSAPGRTGIGLESS